MQTQTAALKYAFEGLMAELVPHLALFISLIGACSGAALSLIFPAIIDLLVQYAANKLNWRVIARDLLILFIGVGGFLSGTFTSVRDIAEAFGEPDDI